MSCHVDLIIIIIIIIRFCSEKKKKKKLDGGRRMRTLHPAPRPRLNYDVMVAVR